MSSVCPCQSLTALLISGQYDRMIYQTIINCPTLGHKLYSICHGEICRLGIDSYVNSPETLVWIMLAVGPYEFRAPLSQSPRMLWGRARKCPGFIKAITNKGFRLGSPVSTVQSDHSLRPSLNYVAATTRPSTPYVDRTPGDGRPDCDLRDVGGGSD